MKIVIAVILSIFLLFLVTQIISYSSKISVSQKKYDDFAAELQKAQDAQKNLRSDFLYYSNPDNLEKELRARFNYKQPGEKMIIIVPKASSTQSSSAQ